MNHLDLDACSVTDHRFGEGSPFTIGIEEEYMLLDPETYDLIPAVEPLLLGNAELSPELFESLLETHTPVCADIAEAHREIVRLRARVADVADANGLRFGAAGTHPFSLFESQRVTARDRYRKIVDELQYVARRELIFGLHVHVGVDDPDTAIAVTRGLALHLGDLCALSASSPFWRGAPTGLASTRAEIFAGFPRSGTPPPFRDYEEYVSVVAELEATGCIEDYTHIWWDVRPHPWLGTVETRIMDAVPRVEDAVAIAAYVQCLVRRYAETGVEPRHPALVAENRWRAIRWGLDAELIDLADDGGRLGVRELVTRGLTELAPYARELGCADELESVRGLLERGNGAMRQLVVYGANHDPVDVARDIAALTSG